MKTKLYNIPKGAKIFAELSDGSEHLIFHHLDGAYSYCTTEKGGVIHLSANTDIERVKGRLTIVED